ncbi:hypothetical protein AAG068_28305 (plasmid) [Bacillus paramycoides]|uniref:hypothetical protein n=1 Tax=Bacillus paramycoides TaxID=2026194 RepID=UPI00318398DB
MITDTKTYPNKAGSTLIIKPVEIGDKKGKKFVVSIPKESYENGRIVIEWGEFIGEGYEHLIDNITDVYMEKGILRIEGYVKGYMG